MNSPSSKNYKHLNFKQKQSPKEIKDKMRKNYREKVQNCREMLMDRFRGHTEEDVLYKTITDLYQNMFQFDKVIENDEIDVLEELKNELVQEEMNWWLKEYEKSQLENVDWSSIEDDGVVCPICQKYNLKLQINTISCSHCKIQIKTSKTLLEIKTSITTYLKKHAAACTSEPQFSVISDLNESHIYLICGNCSEMNVLI